MKRGVVTTAGLCVLLLSSVFPVYGEVTKLSGGWEFYWNRWLSSEDFAESTVTPAPDGVYTPESWQAYGFPTHGIATYRMEVPAHRLPDPLPAVMGLDFSSIYSAYRLYINGRLVEQVGIPGMSRSEETGRVPLNTVFFSTSDITDQSDSLEIILQVSNYSYSIRSGMTRSPVLGDKAEIQRQKHLRVAGDFIIIGSLFLMGLYHVVFFIFRRRDLVSLYLGLFTLDVGFRRFVISGEKMAFTVFPEFSVEVFNYVQLWGIYPLLPLFLLYVYRLYPEIAHRKIAAAITLISILYLVAAHVTTPDISLVTPFYPVLVFGLFYVLFVIARAIHRKKPEARMVGVGFLFIFAVAVNDILNDLEIIDSPYLLGVGFWVFLFFQSLILAKRFSRAFEQVESLSLNLQQTNESLKAMDRMKDEFLANTSHELKTPLNGIIGLSDSLRDGAAGDISPLQDENLELISLSGQRLYALVNDILDFSSLKNNTLTLDIRPTSLRAVIHIVTSITRPMTSKKGLELHVDVPEDLPGVQADAERLQQILFNLTGNAVKFTVRGSVTIRAEALEAEGAQDRPMVAVYIMDTGIGIDPAHQETVFESFRQADGSISRRYGGTGLGLSITRSLVEQHGGTISVHSTPGEGSTFRFTLPQAPAQVGADPADDELAAASTSAQRRVFSDAPRQGEAVRDPHAGVNVEEEPAAGRGYTVLVVDDEAVNLQVLINQLSLYEYRTVTASSGTEALAKLQGGLVPDVVILDVMMPEMSGYELAREIRKVYPASELPILLLTAKDRTQDIIEGFHSGANDYLTKPFSRAELIARVRTHTRLCKITVAYSRFVPREFLEILDRESITDVALGDHIEKEMTVLFADIRSFTRLSEKLTPEENFRFINSFLSRFGPIIRNNGGFVDKYVGDEIMALFPNSPADALAAAAEMRRELVTYNQHRSSMGYEPIDFGVGMHTGLLMMGTVGESQRMDTTVIADIVNTAARLQSLTKTLGAAVIASEAVLHGTRAPSYAVDELPVRPLGSVLVRGRGSAVPIGEVLDETFDQKRRDAGSFAEALQLYTDQAFAEAGDIFETIGAENPADKVALLYAERCRTFRTVSTEELPDGWRYLEQS